MANTAIKGHAWYPKPPQVINAAPAYQSVLLDASTEEAACIVRAPKAGQITHVGYLLGTVTTGPTLDIRLEQVSGTTGDPNDTLLGTNSNGASVVADTDDNVFKEVALTTGPTVTKGQRMAVVIANAGTGNLNIQGLADYQAHAPYSSNFLSGAWSKNLRQLILTLKYSDGSYEPLVNAWPCSALNAVSFNSSSTPDERGMKFRKPVPFQFDAIWVTGDFDNDCDLVIYDSNGTSVMATAVMDSNERQGTTAGVQELELDTLVTCLANTYYRAVIKPTTTSSVTLYEFDVSTAAMMDAAPGGQDFHHTSRTDAGAWTDTTTKRPWMGLGLIGFDNGAGGAGGVKTHPGMAGGARG